MGFVPRCSELDLANNPELVANSITCVKKYNLQICLINNFCRSQFKVYYREMR